MRPLLSTVLLVTIIGSQAIGSGWSDHASGRPLTRLWSPQEATGPNQCVVRDKRGKLYIGNDHVFEFDGRVWSEIPIGGGYVVRSLAVDDVNRIWVGAINEVGFLKERADGKREYVSLVPHLPEGFQPGDVWKVHHLRGKTLFVTKDAVLIWDGSKFEIRAMPNDGRLFSLPFRRGYVISQRGEALWFWDGDVFERLDWGGIEKRGIAFAAEVGGGAYLVDPGGRLGLVVGDKFQPLDGDAEAILNGAGITTAVSLPDGNVCVATFLKGLIIISPEGDLVRQIDRAAGLPSLNCVDLFLDTHDNLWVATSRAVVQLRASNDVSIFDEHNGLDSVPVHRIVTGPRGTYAFTPEYVAQVHPMGDGRTSAYFEPISDLKDFFWDSIDAGDRGSLYAGRYFLRAITDAGATDILRNPDPYFRLLRLTGDRAIAAEGRRVRYIELGENPAQGPILIDDLPEPPADVAVDRDRHLWVTLPRNGIYSCTLAPHGQTSVTQILPSERFATVSNDPRLFVLAGRAYAYNQEEVFRLEPGDHPVAVRELEGLGLFTAERTGDSIVWGVARHAGGPAHLVKISMVSGALHMEAMDSSHLGKIGTAQAIASNAARHELWIAGTQGVLRVDTSLLDGAPAVRPPTILGATWRTPKDSRHLIFSNSTPLPFDAEAQLTFEVRQGSDLLAADQIIETRLAGLERGWTLTAGRRTFTGLREGNYTLEARALDFQGNPGPTSRFPIAITPPWQRSAWAYTGYAILAALAIWGGVILRTRRVARLNVQLEQLVSNRTQELARASAARSAFLANMGHEIRNPLNGVVGLAESLRQANLDEKARETLDRLANCAHQLVSVVEDVLEFSKVDAGKISVRLQPFLVRDPVTAAIDIFRAAAPEAPIQVEAPRTLLGERVIGDPDRVRQILINYLANALKFGGKGQITVGVNQRDGFLTFSVSDQGPGIPREEQERLFIRFSRGRAAHKHNIPGTGLGLAACKAYADAMGADVWVESEPGLGATFFLRMPFRRATGKDAVPTVVAPDIMIGRTALVVDDHEFNRMIMTDLLGRMGATASSAHDIESAKQAFLKNVPDIVFVDFELSGQVGSDLAKWIRAEAPVGRDVPIVATTAFEVDEVRRQCEEAGMDGFLAKPVTHLKIAEIMSRIEAIRAGDAPSIPWTTADDRSIKSSIEMLSGGDPQKRAQLLKSTWEVLTTETTAAAKKARHGDLAEAGTHAHRAVSAAVTLELREVATTARELNLAANAGSRKKAVALSRALQAAVRTARNQFTG